MTGPDTPGATDHTVLGGVDSHADTIHVAVATDRGGHLADPDSDRTPAQLDADVTSEAHRLAQRPRGSSEPTDTPA